MGAPLKVDGRDVLDITSMQDALARPSVVLDKKVYIGRILSIDEWDEFQESILELNRLHRKATLGDGDEETDEALNAGMRKVSALYRDYLHRVFGYRWWQFWKWGSDPTRKILTKAPEVQKRIMQDFFECQGRAMGIVKKRNH